MSVKDQEALAVRVSHMSKWFTDQSYEATTLREVVEALRRPDKCARIEKLESALRVFVASDEMLENILWGEEPDNKIMKIMITLGKYREARAALSSTDGGGK